MIIHKQSIKVTNYMNTKETLETRSNQIFIDVKGKMS